MNLRPLDYSDKVRGTIFIYYLEVLGNAYMANNRHCTHVHAFISTAVFNS